MNDQNILYDETRVVDAPWEALGTARPTGHACRYPGGRTGQERLDRVANCALCVSITFGIIVCFFFMMTL